MKKLLLLCAMATFGLSQASAQLDDEDYGFFNRVSAGVSVGTDGIGFQVAAPMTYHFAVRAGFSFMPGFKYTTSLNLGHDDIGAFKTDKVELEGKLKMSNFSLLFDYYPFTGSSFRVTAGAYICNGEPVSVTNTNDFINPAYAGKAGINLSRSGSTMQEKYVLITDASGNVKADLKVNSFKPYLGFGFGRAVPRKSRVSVSCDFGVKFWGTPKLGAMTIDDWNDKVYHKFSYKDLDEDDDEDLKDALKTIEKITVYPVLNIRISGRIF
jgi:hypothetical protein